MSSDDDKDNSKVFGVEVPVPVLVVPVAPSVTAPDCDSPGTLIVATTTGITYTVDPAYTAGATGPFTATATANQGNVFADSQTVKVFPPVTVAPATSNCGEVGGTEDEDTTGEDGSDSTDGEQAVAGSEDELAATGANVGPAGLGLLLILSGAAFVTARRLALR